MEWELLSSLDDAQRRAVLASARRRRFARNEVIFHEGDPGDSMHLIAKGHVAIRVATPLGDVATLLVLGPGDFFGEMAILSPAPRNSTVVTLDETETMTIHRDQFDELRARHPYVDTVLMDALIGEVRRLSQALLEALYVPADKRVLRRVAELASIFGGGREREASGPVVIPMTQEDIAQLAGTTRPTANKVLRGAEVAGLVDIGRARIEVKDGAGLARKAR